MKHSTWLNTIKFSNKNQSPFQKKPKSWAFREVLHISDAFQFKLVSSSNLQMFRVLFSKNPCNCFTKSKLCTFWETLLFHSHSTGKLLLWLILKIFLFFKKSIIFWGKKMNVPRNRNIRREVAFCDIFAIFSDFEQFMFFLEKLIYFSYKNQFLNVSIFFTISVAFYGKFDKFGTIFKFGNNFFKTHLCFEKHKKLKIFEKSYKFSRFLMEACYF